MILNFIVLLTSTLIYCTETQAQVKSDEPLKGVYFIKKFPFPLIMNDIDQSSDTIGLFYRNDTVLLRQGYIYSNIYYDNDEQITHSTIQYRYFVFKQGEKNGFWMENDSLSRLKFEDDLIVDSVMKKFAIGVQQPLTELLKDSAKLVEMSLTTDMVKKTYVFTHHEHTNARDTLTLEFNKDFIDVPYHLDNYLDMPNKMKLFKYSLVSFCAEVSKDIYPALTVIKFSAYLDKPDPAITLEAEKYLKLAPILAK
jgi:hypothetical protein